MDVLKRNISDEAADEICQMMETHFLDFKSRDISPSKLSKSVSAFANTSGGELFIGVEEKVGLNGPFKEWLGFDEEEAANGIFQMLQQINPLGNNYTAEFIANASRPGLLLHITIFKTQDIVNTTDGRTYVRRNAQNLPLADASALERLRYDKGVKSFEDEIIAIDAAENHKFANDHRISNRHYTNRRTG